MFPVVYFTLFLVKERSEAVNKYQLYRRTAEAEATRKAFEYLDVMKAYIENIMLPRSGSLFSSDVINAIKAVCDSFQSILILNDIVKRDILRNIDVDNL